MSFYCPECWAELPREAAACPACGHPLDGQSVGYVDKLIAALRHFEPTHAALAIYILSDMLAEPRAVGPLVELLDRAEDAFVLQSAARALGRYADPRAVPALGRRALGERTPLVVRLAAVDALARIGGEQARLALEGAVADPNATVREHAEQGLQQVPLTEA